MKIWIVTIYEPLPLMDPSVRPMRWGMMIKALHERGHNIELWTSSFDHIQHKYIMTSSCAELVIDRITVQYMWGCNYTSDISPKRWFHFRQLAKEFRKIAKSKIEKPDLIITQIPSLELAEAVVSYGKDYSIPVIVDIRDLWPDIYLRFLPSELRSYMQWILFFEKLRLKRILKKSVAVTAVSKTYLNWALKYANRNFTPYDYTFYIGYSDIFETLLIEDRNKFRGQFRKKYRISNNAIVILFTGTFCASYDLFTVLKTAKHLEKIYGENLRIVIAGKGEGKNNLIYKAAICSNVILTEWLNAVDLKAALLAADIGLTPYSKKALMSLTNKPFEYMAAGLPLLNSLKGELWSLIQENEIGKCYEGGNVGQLCKAICWFIEHPGETRKMGENARRLFENNFTESKIYNDFANHVELIHNSYIQNKQLGNIKNAN